MELVLYKCIDMMLGLTIISQNFIVDKEMAVNDYFPICFTA